jgi:hypothetical protein
MHLPDFVVIGAPKCGTTSLHRYLAGHPDVYLPLQKELHFFAHPHISRCTNGPGDRDVLARIPATFDEYAKHYADDGGRRVAGEISTSYLYFDDVADDIRRRLGNVKIVAMIRNPVHKAHSQYMHLVRDNRETLQFYDALLAEDGRRREGWSDFWRYAESCLYAERLRTYLRVFGPDNVKVIVFEEFFSDTDRAMRDLLGFLGVRADVVLDTSEVHHRSGKPRSKTLASVLGKRSPVSRAARALLPRPLTDAVQRRLWALNTGSKDPIDPASRTYLEDYCRQDVAKVESLLGREVGWFRGASGRR